MRIEDPCLLWRLFGVVAPAILAAEVRGRSASAADWPCWRGANRDGVVSGFEAPRRWPGELRRLWSVDVGEGHSSPVVSKGKIYQLSRVGEAEVVSCFNFSGQLVWRRDYPAPYEPNSAAQSHGKGPKSTPAVAGGAVCTLGIGGILSGWSADDGKLLWRRDFSKRFQTTSPLYGSAMSPFAFSNGLVVAHVGGHDQGALCGFDVRNGELRWSWNGDGPSYASPILAQLGGAMQLVTQSQDMCIGITLEGRLLWSFAYKTPYTQNIMTPVVCGDLVIVSGRYSGVSAYRVRSAGGKLSAKKAWQNDEVSMYMSSPLLTGRRLYGFSEYERGQLFRLDAATGKLIWRGPGRQGENAALLMAGDVFIALTTEADLVFFQDESEQYRELARFQVADSPVWAHPVILGPRALIKDASRLSMWAWEAL